MMILALDTCLDACSVALECTRAGTIAARFEPMATGHAERLVPMVGEVMQEAGVDFGELDRLAVTCGPGTFTGTRIAVAAARSLALAAEKPLIGVTSLWVMAEEVFQGLTGAECSPDILIATDARRDEVYLQHFRDGLPLCDPLVLSPEAAALRIEGGRETLIAGSGADAIVSASALCRRRSIRLARPDLLPNALYLARLAARLNVSPLPVTPIYLRPADAKPQTGKSIPRVIQ